MVGNGESLTCTTKCSQVDLWLQGHKFQLDLFVLPIRGAEIVLGIQWLELLGDIVTNYKSLVMQFWWKGQQVQLCGQTDKECIQLNQLKKLNSHHHIVSYFQLLLIVAPETINTQSLHEVPLQLQIVLSTFQELFILPKQLPPSRNVDRYIHTISNSKPINVKPYHYPHFQKIEIEKLVVNMLASGIIRPIISPYSSPVILVKKKVGRWHFCIDYRALNQITILNRYPIPIVDEFLDELHGAIIFSKLDLQSGYHQINMAESEIFKTAFLTHEGHYEFLVMPFSLSNAPVTFQNLMNIILKSYLRQFAIIFFMIFLFIEEAFRIM